MVEKGGAPAGAAGQALHRRLWPTPTTSASTNGTGSEKFSAERARIQEITDGELLRHARGNAKFERLYDHGDVDEYGGDDSRADAGLLCMLAYWTACDAKRMEKLFGQCALGQRKKWQRQDYRKATIEFAIEKCEKCWTPVELPELKISCVTADQVTPEPIRWLWQDRIPLGS